MKCSIKENVVLRNVVRPNVVWLNVVWLNVVRASACPLCKDALTLGMAKGFYWSILLMLSVPFAVIVVIAGMIWRAEKRKPADPDSPRA